MTDYFNMALTGDELATVSTLGLAHIGDGVYELLTRTMLCAHGKATAHNLHRQTVQRVCAPAQARAMELIEPLLTEEEHAVYKRGRNAKVNSVPKNASVGDYHAATGLEALFGYLYLNGRLDRINELFAVISED